MSTLPPNIKRLIQPQIELWQEAQSIVLRLAILRDALGILHSEHSRLLATIDLKNATDDARTVKSYELRISALKDSLEQVTAPGASLPKLLATTSPGTPRTQAAPFPKALEEAFPVSKLLRQDRSWELALAHAALSQGWRFWILDEAVEVRKAAEWDKELSRALWPRGVVLFVENSPLSESEHVPEGRWLGRWIAVLAPELDPRVERSRERWTLIFDPGRKRHFA